MKALAINGSPRHDGNTNAMLETVLAELGSEGFDTDILQLGGKPVQGCTACRACFEMKNGKCILEDDMVNKCISEMSKADVILLGSPTYFGDITAEMKAMIDRAGYVSKANGDLFSRKIGAAVVPARRAGSMHGFDTINHFFFISDMIVPGSTYWNISLSRDLGDFHTDAEGLKTMKRLAANIAWLAKKINS